MTIQQFKPLPYQAVAARAVVDVFEGQPRIEGLSYQVDPGLNAPAQLELIGGVGLENAPLVGGLPLLDNLRRVQMRQTLPPSDALAHTKAARINLDVEMETGTGTGKTYVYIDTMYRLYERYGWSKFVVVVPSVAIREGVFQTFADTEAHFQDRYGHKVRRFIYDSARPEPILAFSDSPGLHCMVINTQAFNAEAKAEGGDGARLRMFREMDAFQSRRPIDLIAANRPILIIDEPQRIGSDAVLTSLGRFKAEIALRYSATHRTRHNLVHRLDALDAYTRKLVKRIAVRGVTMKGLPGTDGYLYLSDFRVSADKPPEARVQIEIASQGGTVRRVPRWLKKNDKLVGKSDGLAAYEGYVVSDIDAGAGTLSFTNGQVLEAGRVQGDVDEAALRRVQIRETIRAHFERERLLHPRGIKVLSLFFIDEVAKYRRYGSDGEKLPGEYAAMFEEEYAQAVADFPALDGTDEAWRAYVRRDQAVRVHDGYFSIDKKSGRLVDPGVNARGEEKGEAKDASAYDLILKDKARLLSLGEPVRFIFSHSALREGWDNPNVFTICTLKQSDHEIGKRQEVGRGLRISVTSDGRRTDGPEVHDVNVLTVVASESYQDFAKGLQSEMAEALKGRPREASEAYFLGKTIETSHGSHELTAAEAKALNRWLWKHAYINDADLIQPAWHEAKAGGTLATMPEPIQLLAEGLIALIDTVLDESALRRMVGDDRKTVKLQVRRANLDKAAFRELWDRINQKAVYFTQFDSDLLVKNAVRRLDAELKVDSPVVVVSGAQLRTDVDLESLRAGRGFAEERATFRHEQPAPSSTVSYDLVGDLAGRTRLTRATVGRILKGVCADTFALFGVNPEMFLRGAADLIRREKVALAIEALRYEKTGERYDVAIFTEDQPEGAPDLTVKVLKHVYDHVATDSKGELEFAKALEADTDVGVFAKLPRGFTIPVPDGSRYNPDWAIVFETAGERKLYFVAETKGSADAESLRGDEKQRIESAEAYFRDVVGKSARFEKVASYDQLRALVT